MATEISPLLTAIYQKSFDCRKMRDDWKSTSITSDFKKGDRLKAGEYPLCYLTACTRQHHNQ